MKECAVAPWMPGNRTDLHGAEEWADDATALDVAVATQLKKEYAEALRVAGLWQELTLPLSEEATPTVVATDRSESHGDLRNHVPRPPVPPRSVPPC